MPPLFEYEEYPDGRLLMHYSSKRRLCALLHGLILGVGDYFEQELSIKETACMAQGKPRCIFEIQFP